jgi:hypothetical protein
MNEDQLVSPVLSALGAMFTAKQAAAVRAELKRVLESPPFRPSRRCQKLLIYVVEETLTGRAESLKERTLGVEVFARAPAYDTSEDSSVRVCAGEVRKRLAQCYVDAGHSHELRIELPPGSYVPLFHWTEGAKEPNVPAQTTPTPAWTRASWGRSLLVLLLACVLVLVSIYGARVRSPAEEPALAAFWKSIIGDSQTLLVCVGGHLAYMPTGSLRSRIISHLPSDHDIEDSALQLPADEKLTGADFRGSIDEQINTGDAHSAVLLAQVIGRFGSAVQFRLPYNSTVEDLRNAPTVLVGAFNNRWALALGEYLPFALEGDWTKGPVLIREHGGKRREWTLTNAAPGERSEIDYALISRILNAFTGKPVLQIGGISHMGTLAAAEFVTSEAALSSALSKSGDWRKRNVQIVLRVLVANGNPNRTEVVATRIW